MTDAAAFLAGAVAIGLPLWMIVWVVFFAEPPG